MAAHIADELVDRPFLKMAFILGQQSASRAISGRREPPNSTRALAAMASFTLLAQQSPIPIEF